MTVSFEPRLTLVGAGPGDPDLITVKALKALQSAQVVLYDALANPELLNHAPQAKHVFVGKRKGFKRYSQEEIHALIIRYAHTHGHVVRLKGGDPFVFGRGQEEREAALEAGIKVDVVPGITSAFGVPASRGISVTTRGLSESVWVITGTTSRRTLSQDVLLAAQSTATVVILMGMHTLPQTVAAFQAAGKGSLPIALIQSGTLPECRSVLGTVDTILELRQRAGIGAPAVIVAGAVAAQLDHQHVQSFIHQFSLSHVS